mmetsp:Transcript_115731/g.172953  ORF Transcript_115731/g.172953 Transcript_115731/m.172953 type:complete len:866 (+) Transcript_115731:92-2689(+)
MPSRKGDYDDYGANQPAIARHDDHSAMPPPPTNLRQTTTFSGDVEAKQRASDRRQRRSREGEEAPQRPGPVRVPGIGASSVVSHKSHDSKVKKDDDHNNLLTAIPVEDDSGELDEMEKKRIEEKAKKDVRLKIFAGAVEAEVADLDAQEKERDQKKCRRMMIYGCIVFLLLAGGGAAVGIALSSSAPEETESPTLVPTTSPTVRPPIFIPPSNVTDSQIETLDNTVCEGAFDIATTIGEPFFGNIPDHAVVAPVDTCEVIFRNGVGVWYRILGDGSRYSASTCNSTSFDTQISIFSGACGKLRCAAGNDQMDRCGNGDQSLVGFATEPGESYYIYVQARRQSLGLFNLLVDKLVSNVECEGAAPLELYGSTIFDSTRGSTIDNVECFGTVPTAPGVWYTIEGDEFAFEFRVLYDTSDTAFSFLRTMVFTGDDCGSLTCVENNNRWQPLAGVTYYILVYGRDEATEGDYRISIDEGHDLAYSIQPSVPGILFPGAITDGSTRSERLPQFGSCGNLVFGTASAAWFEVPGTGGALTVSTCNTTTGFDTQISVLQGSFDELTCVDGNDQACGDQSSVSWFSDVGVTYFVAVHGYATHEGRFTVSLQETDVIVSGTCESASPLASDGVSVLGSTESIVPGPLPPCGVTSSGGTGVWYLVVGTGRSMTVSTCSSSEATFTTITVFRSGCNNLGCVDTVESPCGTHHSITWDSESGAEYHVFVQSQDSSVSGGPFVLHAEGTTINDHCENAIGPVGVDGSLTYGSTRSATADALASASRGVWYSVLGTGSGLIASTCSGFTDFPTLLSVYQGIDSCETLAAVTTTVGVGDCSFGSIQSWISEVDEVYYVLVAGALPDDFGNFALELTSIPV